MKRFHVLVAVLWIGAQTPNLYGQSCPSSCTTITSGTLTFCRCLIYSSPGDRLQLITDKSVTIVDVDGDGLRDIPFGVWYHGTQGAYVLRQVSGGIPGTFAAHRISPNPTYGITNLGDINDDGVVDFAIGGHNRNFSVYLVLSNGPFPSYRDTLIYYNPPANPNSVINRGGVVYWTEYTGHFKYYDLGSRTLSDVPFSRCGDGIATGDFNGDGNLDVACSSYGSSGGLFVFYGDGISFPSNEIVQSGEIYQGIAGHDIDGDGRDEIIGVGAKVSIWHWSLSGWSREVVGASLSNNDNPLARLNLADLDCDGDVDIIVASACPSSPGNTLKWYENTGGGWVGHPIETSGSNCSGAYPYPYGVRVGLLDETGDTGRADIVIVRSGNDRLWAYYNVTDSISCSPLVGREDLGVNETSRTARSLEVKGRYITAEGEGMLELYRADGRLVLRRYVRGRLRHGLGRGVYLVKFGVLRRVVVVR